MGTNGHWVTMPEAPHVTPPGDGGLRKVIEQASKQVEMVKALQAFQGQVAGAGLEIRKVGDKLAELASVPAALREMAATQHATVKVLHQVIERVDRPPQPVPVPGARVLPYLIRLGEARDVLCDQTQPPKDKLAERLRKAHNTSSLPPNWSAELAHLRDRYVALFDWKGEGDAERRRLERLRDVHDMEGELMRLFDASAASASTSAPPPPSAATTA